MRVNPGRLALIGLIERQLVLFLISGLLLFHGTAALAQTTVVLGDTAEIDISASSAMWIDVHGQTSIEQLVAEPRRARGCLNPVTQTWFTHWVATRCCGSTTALPGRPFQTLPGC